MVVLCLIQMSSLTQQDCSSRNLQGLSSRVTLGLNSLVFPKNLSGPDYTPKLPNPHNLLHRSSVRFVKDNKV